MRTGGVFYVLMVLMALPAKAQEIPERVACEGDGCDAYLPVAGHVLQYEDVKGEKRLNSALGGLAGGIIGADIAGAPGAIALGALGIAAGYKESNKKRWETEKRVYEKGYLSGADMFYDPSHRIPLTPHWMMAGPAGGKKK